jgi:hypothetical protein
MTRQELAEALLLDVQGLDESNPPPRNTRKKNIMGPYGYDSEMQDDDVFGADDPVKRAGLSTLPIQISIANAASLSLDLFKSDDLDAAALPTGVVSPALAGYKNVIKDLLASPSQLQSIVIQSNESATGGAPVLSSLRIAPKRVTPFGMNASNEIRVQSYQTTQDFQANRITIPLKVALDAFSFLNMVSDVNASGSAVVLNITLMIGRRMNAAAGLKGSPMRVLPGGRGPVPLKK